MTNNRQNWPAVGDRHDERGAVGRRLVGRGADTLLDGLVFWPAAGLFAGAVANSYSQTAGLLAYAGLVVAMAAAAVADAWLAWRRRRAAVSTDLQRLSVYIDNECAAILHAVGLLGQSEGAAARPAGAGPDNAGRADLNGAVRRAQEAVSRLSHAHKPGRVDGSPNGGGRGEYGRWN